MPQITIEYSENLKLVNPVSMLMPIHEILVKSLPADLVACKSRIIKHNEYLVGDGQPNNAFLHAEIRILAGRSAQVIEKARDLILEHLRSYLNDNAAKEASWHLSVAIDELPESYKKCTN